MDLNDALGELVRKYGVSVIGESRLAGLLSDLGALESPELRTAAEAFSSGWYGKELLRLAAGALSADLPGIADGITAALVTNHGADPGAARSFTGSAAEAIGRASGGLAAAPFHTGAFLD